MHIAHPTSWIGRIENAAMDSMMYVSSNTLEMVKGNTLSPPLKLAFIDIDEDSYRKWGEPFYSPRHKIQQLLYFAANSGARAIILDVDLSKPSEDDQKLTEFLQNYKENYPPLFLLRSRYPASECTQHRDYHLRPSFLDGKLGKNIYWGQSLFKASDYDQELRYWELYEIGCLNGKPVVIPAFQLLVDVYLTSPSDLEKIIDQLQQKLPESCDALEQLGQALSGELRYGNKTLKLEYNANQRIGERIIYTLPWKQSGWDEFYQRSAHKIVKENQTIGADAARDRVIVIGASYKDSRDIYRTPIGEMPGAMIILNAVKSLHMLGQIEPPSGLYKWSIEIGLIILISWAFAQFHSMLAALIIGILILLILVPISFGLFKYGVWVDFALPLLGIQMHQMFEQYKERIVLLHRHINRKHSTKE
ncbi:MAG: CHASE2 domain-containing protein [Proteobacteria bacterium]|nr:CHASE2 domain-containing protein [Pseudomonadota bacterium]